MPKCNTRLIPTAAMLLVGLVSAGCGAVSPTAPEPQAMTLGAGSYALSVFGKSACLSSSGAVSTSATVAITLSNTSAFDVWKVSVPGNSLSGEIAIVNGTVQGWLRGSALGEPVRLSTGATPDEAVGFEGTLENNSRYTGAVLVGSPRFEGIGAASGAVTTCESNGFTLRRS